ncbi:hypothetical protein ASE75_13650 [Sphingomonas sp. Leaf17]|uniref:tyrosine-type recombinase/integrase n=1 Tax=Sphingomonas sp. Leaf17 TaxID=1735683 RepID=UPI0006FF6AEF|nr:site-specific integrase [Sphingomonas sp. Leaf17]KQM62670.1 hypothetical protein ASE75_13650 [Sphingomonas sp. Leaf17]
MAEARHEAKADRRKRFGPFVPATVKTAPPGTHLDNDGLYLLVSPTGARSWFLRVQVEGKRRDIGLGAADTRNLADRPGEPIPIPIMQRKQLTLKEAREKARLLREAAKAGLDPVAERDRERIKLPTFSEAAKATHAALQSGWKGRGADTFINSLENHVIPLLGNKRVSDITAADVTAALEPIWTTKPDMARKVRQRIGKVLNFAHAKGWRATEAPGRSVSVGLVRQPAGANYRAMPYADVPTLVAELQGKPPTIGRRALLFQILTAARPGEVRNARWGQMDLAKQDWKRPAAMMKMGKEHTITLSSAAVRLLEQVKGGGTPKAEDLVFTAQRGGTISDMTMTKALRAAGHPYDVHGFRSSFRTWAAEKMPTIPEPVAEKALAHFVPDAVERAYQRAEFVEMRRTLLDAWGRSLFSELGAESNG